MTPQSGEWFEEFPTPREGTRMPVPTPPNGRAPVRAIAVFAGVAGLLVGAALTSGFWLLFGNENGSSSSVSAPARLGDYHRFADVPRLASGDNQRKTVDRQTRYDKESSARLSAAHGGAGAVVQQYATEDLDAMFSLEVVRARSPFPPYVPFSDAKDLGLDKPLEEVVRYGSVACAVRNNPGGPAFVMTCLRTGDDLTVAITHVTSELAPADVAKLVDQAWSEVS
jgi:hypothetical protein